MWVRCNGLHVLVAAGAAALRLRAHHVGATAARGHRTLGGMAGEATRDRLGLVALLLASVRCGAPAPGDAAHDASGGGAAAAAGTSASASSTGAAAGAGTGEWPDCADPPSPEPFELGTGIRCLTRIADGDTVPIILGGQGGRHVWAALGCSEHGAETTVRYGLEDVATGDWYPGTEPQTRVVALDPDGWGQVAGLRAYLPDLQGDETTEIPAGTPMVLSAAVLEGGAITHAAEVQIVLGEAEYEVKCDLDPATCGQPDGPRCCYE
jgi:hypothetical protein